jgi:hypothetical protein
MLKKVQELGYNMYVKMVENSKTWNWDINPKYQNLFLSGEKSSFIFSNALFML